MSYLNEIKCSKSCLAARRDKNKNWFCRWMGAYCSICWFVHAVHPWTVKLPRVSLFVEHTKIINQQIGFEQKIPIPDHINAVHFSSNKVKFEQSLKSQALLVKMGKNFSFNPQTDTWDWRYGEAASNHKHSFLHQCIFLCGFLPHIEEPSLHYASSCLTEVAMQALCRLHLSWTLLFHVETNPSSLASSLSID